MGMRLSMENITNLKEQRRHGDELMPINAYEYFAPYGITPMYAHWHNEMELFLLCEGSVKLQCGDSFYSCTKGDMLFFNSGALHSAEKLSADDVRFRSVVFSPDIMCGTDLIRAKYIKPVMDGKLLLPVRITNDMGIHESFGRLFDAITGKSFGYELEVKEQLFKIFHKLVENAELSEGEEKNFSAAAVRKSIEYINKNYAASLTLEELAEMSNMSVGHFCRIFKLATLKTPIQYINNIRTAKAAEMLISTNSQILDISLDTGFNSVSYFISVFKENMGMTPSRFRKEYKR